MSYRDSEMYRMLKGGVRRTLEESGFEPRSRRLFVREHEDGYAFIEFFASKYGGFEFDEIIGIYYRPMQEVYDCLFPDRLCDIYSPDDRWSLLCHTCTSPQVACMVDIARDPYGPSAYRIERNAFWQKWEMITHYAGPSASWMPDPSDISGAVKDWTRVWKASGMGWIDHARDPSFIASWIEFDPSGFQYKWCHAMTCYALAGDRERAQRILDNCLAAAAVPLDKTERGFRGSRFLGLGTGLSTEHTRARAARRYELTQKAAEVARRAADHFGLAATRTLN